MYFSGQGDDLWICYDEGEDEHANPPEVRRARERAQADSRALEARVRVSISGLRFSDEGQKLWIRRVNGEETLAKGWGVIL